jgi:hypothetical protein
MRSMRKLVVATVAAVVLGTCGIAAAKPTPAPSLVDCAKAWNAAPPLKASHERHPASMLLYASNSAGVAAPNTPAKASWSGFGCIVSVERTKNHGLTVQGRWSSTTRIAWQEPVSATDYTTTNAVVRADGRISLRSSERQ